MLKPVCGGWACTRLGTETPAGGLRQDAAVSFDLTLRLTTTERQQSA